MPSITYWNRLESRSRANDLRQALAARVHDPAWLLARQWQFGEFRAEDAASPAYVQFTAELMPFTSFAFDDGESTAVDGATPLERPLLAERFSADDVTTMAELGRVFERVLQSELATELLPIYRGHYQIESRADDDSETQRLCALWRGRVVDGLALYRAAKAVHPALPPPAIPATGEPAARAAIAELLRAAEQVYGGNFGSGDPSGWDAERLEYTANVTIVGAQSAANLDVHVPPDGRLDWYSFDVASEPAPSSTGESRVVQRSVIPAAVMFRGMPKPRWWDFEDGRVDFGGLKPDRRDLARLLFADFMLVHSNDWFLVPFEQPLGSACRVSSMVVRDVFGGDTTISRGETATGSRWSLFSTARGGAWADWFLVPPCAGPALQVGPDLEEVRFLRDQTANMVWAVEHATESRLGQPLPGIERERAVPADPLIPPAAALRYAIQTRVPHHWIPFVPVKLDATTSEIALEIASVLDPSGPQGAPPVAPVPLGRVLQPSIDGPYQIREEEVPREGTRVVRTVRSSRWTDGSTHLWVARRRSVGTGEGSSGLGFDLALPLRS